MIQQFIYQIERINGSNSESDIIETSNYEY